MIRAMHHSQPETRKARKPHKCTWCAEEIPVGEKYTHWLTYDDGIYPNKMHDECYEVANADGPFEYTPFDNQRPKAIDEFEPLTVTGAPDAVQGIGALG